MITKLFIPYVQRIAMPVVGLTRYKFGETYATINMSISFVNLFIYFSYISYFKPYGMDLHLGVNIFTAFLGIALVNAAHWLHSAIRNRTGHGEYPDFTGFPIINMFYIPVPSGIWKLGLENMGAGVVAYYSFMAFPHLGLANLIIPGLFISENSKQWLQDFRRQMRLAQSEQDLRRIRREKEAIQKQRKTIGRARPVKRRMPIVSSHAIYDGLTAEERRFIGIE